MNLKIYKKTRYQNIYKHIKNETYAVDISLGYNASGKRVRTTRTGLLSIDDAKKVLSDSKIKSDIKIKITNKLKFCDAWNQHMYDCKNIKKLAYNTIKKKEYAYDNYISKFFNNFTLTDIKKNDVADFHKYLDKTELSDRTKNDIHKILSAFLNWCIGEELITKNPASYVSNYKYESKEKEIWSLEQFKTFINCVENDYNNNPFKSVFVATITKIFFLGGIRLEELLSLKKSVINKNGIDIKHGVIYEKGIGYVEKETKTKESTRIVDFGDKMIKTINDYINFYESFYNVRLNDDDYLFTNIRTGNLYSDNTIRKYIKEYTKKCDVPELTPHCLRHSHATLLHDQGWDMFDISKRLGHSNTNITQKVYTHFSNERREKIAENMDAIL